MSIFRRSDMISVPREEYLALRDAVSSKAATAWSAGVRVVEVGPPVDTNFTERQIEQLLRRHYIEVLGSKSGRAMWRKLLRQATAVETVEQIGK